MCSGNKIVYVMAGCPASEIAKTVASRALDMEVVLIEEPQQILIPEPDKIFTLKEIRTRVMFPQTRRERRKKKK